MEQSRSWMSTKRKHSLTSHSSYDSWEELAFAEDAAGGLGGCIWPPRSYSCSFCRREFRSAQALGGHMNVHRRDRARLKQSPPLPQNDQNHNSSDIFQNQNTSSPVGFRSRDPHNQVCTLLCSPNPNSDPIIISSSSPSKASKNSVAKSFFPSFSSPTKEDQQVNLRISSPSYNFLWPDRTSEGLKSSKHIESGCRYDHVSSGIGEEEEGIQCKRRKINNSASLPLFVVKSNSIEIGACSKEELDLELRLGDRPKVK